MPVSAIVVVYLVAIVAANLTVAAFGPAWSIVNAALFVGLDLTTRDRLADAWRYDRPRARMAGLIALGGVISFALNAGAAQIALASTIAFVVASSLDAIAYWRLERYRQLVRTNGSNVVGAAADSLLFVGLAFGWLPLVMLAQFAAKVGGGFVWSLLLPGRDFAEPEQWEMEYQTAVDLEVDQ